MKEHIKYFLTIDLELTCDNTSTWNPANQEIIEIGWVLSDLEFNIIKSGYFFVKPLKTLALSEFCQNLTGIFTKDLQYAPKLSIAVHNWYTQLGVPSSEIMLTAWGSDARILQQELASQGYKLEFDEHFINLKLVDKLLYNRPKGRRGLKAVCQALNLTLEQPQHRALPDAKTAFKVLKQYKTTVDDYQASNDFTYKHKIIKEREEIALKLNKRTKMKVDNCLKILQIVNFDFQQALNLIRLVKKD